MFERQYTCFDIFPRSEDFPDGISEFQCDGNTVSPYIQAL